jgi:protein-tyrosine-phosphatase
LDAGIETQVISNLHHARQFRRFSFESFDSIQTIAERLFDKYIGATPDGAQSLLDMMDRRRANQNHIRPERAERFFEIGEGLEA